jgi:hypothetical protein
MSLKKADDYLLLIMLSAVDLRARPVLHWLWDEYIHT